MTAGSISARAGDASHNGRNTISSTGVNQPQYKVGDIVNGHILTAQNEWVLVAPVPTAVGATPPVKPKLKWFRRKRFFIPVGLIALFVILSNLHGSPKADEVDSAEVTSVRPDESAAAEEELATEPVPAEAAEEPLKASAEAAEAKAELTAADLTTVFNLALVQSGDAAFEKPEVRAASVGLAKSFCDSLGTGASVATTVTIYLSQALDSDITPEMLGYIIGAGVPAFCPEYSANLDEFYASL
jgi:hypothetical protein